ncbi:MAG: hypothetical protein K2I99_01870 [Bacteroidaceae bacterium]|nr:hypothetical protein [Bacteroidaceae bacterium]
MKCNIEIVNDVKYLKGIDGEKVFKVSDYIYIDKSSLTIVGIVVEKTDYFYWGKTHTKYKRLWGCIDASMNVIIPFIYQHMKQNFSLIEASIDYRDFYFNLNGIPVIYSTKVEMFGWDWVEDSDNGKFLIAQKGGKQGIVRKDGSVFLEPKYQKIKINFSILLITCFYDDSMVAEIHYRKDLKLWKFLPKGCTYVCFSEGSYILRRKDGLEFVTDKNYNMILYPWFDEIDICSNCYIVRKNNKWGIISRNKNINIEGFKDPVPAPLTRIEFDAIKKLGGGGSRVTIVKNNLQGVFDLKNEKIMCSPCISVEYQIFPNTLNDNSIAFKTIQRKYGYFDLDGHLLFEINIEDDKINDSSIRCFQNGKVHIFGENYLYIFNKEGSYEKIRLKKQYYSGETYHNYEAERWDALTDGMEGDYPGSSVDYDMLGFD